MRNCFLIVVALLTGNVHGETINWFNPAQKSNLTSTGQEMDGAFQFQLGVFTGGFIPTPGNAVQWTSHWVSAQTTSYNPATKSFDSIFSVTGNSAPFSVGASAYIWGRRLGANNDEWILFRKSDWNWPAPNLMNPFPLDWNAAQADQVILGTLHSGGIPFLMKSAAILYYAQWRDTHLAGNPLNLPEDDPDQDGTSNLLEFVFGTSPSLSSAPPNTPASLVDVAGLDYLEILVPRLANRLATLKVEVSGDLVEWNSGSGATLEISNTSEMLVVRDRTPSGSGQRFMRLKVETPP